MTGHAMIPVILTVIALATGIASGSAFFVFAPGASQSLLDICGITSSEVTEESPFLKENGAAMTKMITDMAVKPTGNVDTDFVAMMIPHHQGAIEMAKTVLRYGRNAQLKRLAQEIVVTQQQEIIVMRLAVGDKLSASPTHVLAPSVPGTR